MRRHYFPSLVRLVRRSMQVDSLPWVRCYGSMELDGPARLLEQLHRLATRVNQTPSVNEKRRILEEYPGCLRLLQRIYDPHVRHHVSSKSAQTYLNQHRDKLAAPANAPTHNGVAPLTLETLLHQLSTRAITGHAALDTIGRFYLRHCATPEQQHVFWRVLDRNLKMGASTKTIRRLLDNEDDHREAKGAISAANDEKSLKQGVDRRFMHVALASAMPRNFTSDALCQKSAPAWFVSRKLDGVRCLAFVHPENSTIQFCSRTGRPFDTLGRVERALRQQLLGTPEKLAWQTQFPHGFVLDGEICVYTSNDNLDCPSDLSSINNSNNSSENPARKEDFVETLRQIRSKGGEMVHPMYEIFDLIDMDVFRRGAGGLGFQERYRLLRHFLTASNYVHILDQHRVRSKEQLEAWKHCVLKLGWEGLIMRQDVPYEGKRSRRMLKIKEWDDAEYKVHGIELGKMRVPTTGEDAEMLTSVLIQHKGHPVSVGSGFSMQQRLAYAQDPSRIIGKIITVKFFSESVNEQGGLSLRFPTVKAVYDEPGGRDA